MDGEALLYALKAHNYFLVAVLVIGWLTRLTSDMSRFPVTLPKRWQPVLVIALGQTYAVLQAILGGTSVRDAVLSGLVTSLFTMGFYDVFIKALFNGREPRWVGVLSLIFPPAKESEKVDPPS